MKHTVDWDSAAAEREFRQALAFAPGDAAVHLFYGYFLAQRSHMQEAFDELEIARQSNPISSKMNVLYGMSLYLDHRYANALAKFQSALDIAPTAGVARHMLRVYEQSGDLERAIAIFPKTGEWWGVDDRTATADAQELKDSYAREGSRGYWKNRLRLRSRAGASTDWQIAQIYVRLGDREQALGLLENECAERDHALRWYLKTDPQFDDLRGEPRFQALLRKVAMLEPTQQ